jgi:hypothetical protein
MLAGIILVTARWLSDEALISTIFYNGLPQDNHCT